MNLRIDVVLIQKIFQNDRIRGSDFLVVKPFQPLIIDIFGNSERQPAFAEAQTRHDIRTATSFYIFILSYYAKVGNPRSYALGNVVITQI